VRCRVVLACLGAAAVALCPTRSLAQGPPGFVLDASEPAASVKAGKVLRAYRITGEPPRIDAVLEDEVWRHAESAGQLVQWDPDNNDPLSEATSMQVAYDDRYVYVAIRCDDRTPDRIAAGLGRRDEFPPTDTVGIGFDPRHDHQTGYVFATNPSGVQQDLYFFDDDNSDRDFNAVWEVRSAITDKGWVAEYRIPFSQMRFTASPTAGQVWGFSIRRTIRRRSETGEWTAKPRGEQGEVSRWGHLVFDAPIRPPRRIEWQPYVLAGGTRVPDGANDLDAGAGLDLRVGLGTSATLSATVNPDFAQVEQDPAVLNLTVFETFFPEKRPFFLEDSRTFVPPYGIFQAFHSRRIGAPPDRFEVPDNEEETDRPDQTTILGAAKLTGKASKLTYGALTAVTSSEAANVLVDGEKKDRVVEPLTSYNVVRLQRDFRESSNVGVIATSVFRNNDQDAFTGGFDYNLKWDRNRTNLNGHWVGTHAPDDDHVMKSGYGGVSNFNFSRKHGNIFGHFDHFDRNFKVTDLGFFRARSNRTEVDLGFGLEQPDPWKIFRRLSMFFNTGQGWNDERLLLGRFAGGGGFFELKNFWSGGAGLFHGVESFDDLDTRGGPPIVSPAGYNSFFFFESDSRKTWRISAGGNVNWNDAGSHNFSFGPGVTLQPSTRLQLSINTNVEVGLNDAQWIENQDADGDGEDDTYVYGKLKRNVVDMTFRATYAIQRDLTLQVFLQPFVAVGDYTDIKKLAEPRSYKFEPATVSENPDFNDKSLRGNVVLRWEYIRGSTLYVAWNMSTSDDARPGVFRFSRDLKDAFRAPGTHAVLVKVSYWLSK
jgi:hypothetical protein